VGHPVTKDIRMENSAISSVSLLQITENGLDGRKMDQRDEIRI